MTPELQKYYEQRLSMCGDPAWKDLCDDVRKMLESTDKISSVKDDNDLWFKKGEISIMNWILSLREVSEEAYELLKEDGDA